MAEKRIIEYDEASTVTNDDYIYMDSQVNGQQKITPNRLVSMSQAYYSQGNSIIQLGEHVDDVESAMQSIVSDVGDLSELETEDKSSLVGAINEAAQSGGGGGTSPSPYTSNPSSLGTASAGSSSKYSRGDHVHPMPSASDVGALPSNTVIPSKTSDLTNDSGFITSAPVTSVNGNTGAVTLDADDVGAETAITKVTIATDGAVTQALAQNTWYHFTGDLTSLTVTASAPTAGRYQFDFISGSTAPTLTIPDSWTIPNQFIIEPNARYKIVVEEGFMYLNKWSDNHNPFTYVDINSGAYTLNTSGVTAGNVYSNIGTEIVSLNFSAVKPKSQISNNGRLKVCDISADTKALIGKTYVSGSMFVGTTGKVTEVIFNTWDAQPIIEIHNSTGSAIAANTSIDGSIYILRTI